MVAEKKTTGLAFFRDPDIIFQLIVFCSSISLSIITRTYPLETRVFPEILLYVIIFLSGSQLLMKFFFPKLLLHFDAPGAEDDDDDEVVRARDLSSSRFYKSWLAIGIVIAVFILFGFVFTIPVYFMVYAIFLGQQKNLMKLAVIALMTTGVIYIIFGYFLYVPMIGGLFLG